MGNSFLKLPIALMLIVAATLGLIASAALKNSGQIVGNPERLGVVLDQKWKRITQPSRNVPPSVEDVASFKCNLQRCESNAVVTVIIIRATGLLSSEDKVADGSITEVLSREKALSFLASPSSGRMTAMLDMRELEDNLRSVVYGPLHGYRTTFTMAGGATPVLITSEIFAVGDKILIFTASNSEGQASQTDLALAELEDSIRSNGKSLVE